MGKWRETTLGEVADEVTVGFVGPMTHEYRDHGIPFLRSQNVKAHSVDLGGVKYIDRDFSDRLKKSRLCAGDVVTVRTGLPGVSALVPPELDGANCADLVITRPGQDLDGRWLSYYINGAAQHFISSHLVGAVQQHFNVGAAKRLALRLPSLAEQRAIAEVLGALDDKIAANDRLADTADALASSLFDAAAASAPLVRMSERLRPVLGATPSRSVADYWIGEVSWASAKDVAAASHAVVLDSAESISRHAVELTRARALPVGSVILTARGTVGAVARLGVRAAFNQSCYGFVPGDLPAGVLFFVVRFAAARSREHAHGSVFDTITVRTFDHLEVPDFDPAESSVLEAQLGPLLAVVDAHEREKRTIAATRDALLPALMSGALRVADAERLAADLT